MEKVAEPAARANSEGMRDIDVSAWMAVRMADWATAQVRLEPLMEA